MRGNSERDFGKVLKKYPRDDYILQTKVAPQPDAEAFRAAVMASFERLDGRMVWTDSLADATRYDDVMT